MDSDSPFCSILGAMVYLGEIVVVPEVPHTKLLRTSLVWEGREIILEDLVKESLLPPLPSGYFDWVAMTVASG